MNGESCMHLFRLSMIPEIYCQFCFLPCTMSKSPVKVIIMTIIYLTTQTRCFVFLPCVYMHEHIMYRKYAASDALNGIEICHLKSFQEKKTLKKKLSLYLSLQFAIYHGMFSVAMLLLKYIYTNIPQMLPPILMIC